jgi:hypothetical protein
VSALTKCPRTDRRQKQQQALLSMPGEARQVLEQKMVEADGQHSVSLWTTH